MQSTPPIQAVDTNTERYRAIEGESENEVKFQCFRKTKKQKQKITNGCVETR